MALQAEARLEEVYRVEVFVHHFRPVADLPRGTPTLTFRLWQFPALTILPEVLAPQGGAEVVRFDSGKSCLFQMPKVQFESLLPFPIHLTLGCDSGDHVQEVGWLATCAGSFVLPPRPYCSMVGSSYPLLDVGGAKVGDLVFDLKLSNIIGPSPAVSTSPCQVPCAAHRLEQLVDELKERLDRFGEGRVGDGSSPVHRSTAVQCDGAELSTPGPLAGTFCGLVSIHRPEATPLASGSLPPAHTSQPRVSVPVVGKDGGSGPPQARRVSPVDVHTEGSQMPARNYTATLADTELDGWSIASSTPSASSERGNPSPCRSSSVGKTPLASSSGPLGVDGPLERLQLQRTSVDSDSGRMPRPQQADDVRRGHHALHRHTILTHGKDGGATDPHEDRRLPPALKGDLATMKSDSHWPPCSLAQYFQEDVIAQLLPVVDVAHSLAHQWPELTTPALPDALRWLLEHHRDLICQLVHCTNQLWFLLSSQASPQEVHLPPPAQAVPPAEDDAVPRFSASYEPLLLPAPLLPNRAVPLGGEVEWARPERDHPHQQASALATSALGVAPPAPQPVAALQPTAAQEPATSAPRDRSAATGPAFFPPPPLLALGDDSSTTSEPSPSPALLSAAVEGSPPRRVLLRSQTTPVLPQHPPPDTAGPWVGPSPHFPADVDQRGNGAPFALPGSQSLPPTDLAIRRKRSSILQRLQSPSRSESGADQSNHVSPSEKWFGSTRASIELDVPVRWLGDSGKLNASSPVGSAASSARTPTGRAGGRRVSKLQISQIFPTGRGSGPLSTRAKAKPGTPPAKSPPTPSPCFPRASSAALPTSGTASTSSNEEVDAAPSAMLAFQQSMAALMSQMD